MPQTLIRSEQYRPQVIKPSDTSRANNIVLSADPHIVTPNLIANASYWLRVCLGISGTAAAGGIQISWTTPAGAAIQGNWVSSAVANSVVIQNSSAGVNVITAANMKARQILVGDFYVNIAATAGTVTMNWAQVTTNAAGVVVQGGSYIDAIKVL